MKTIILAGILKLPVILAGVIAFLAGGALSYFLWNLALGKKKKKIIREAEAESEVIKKDKILQAKEKFLQLKSEHEKYHQREEQQDRYYGIKTQAEGNDACPRNGKKQQRTKNEIEAIRENLNSQLLLVDKKTEELEQIAQTGG